MKQFLQASREREVLSLLTGIAYTCVPAWYGASQRDLKMDLIVPKYRAGHAPCPTILWLCGGAFSVVDRSIWLPQLMPLAERGYVIASAEYRTSNEQPFPAALEDVKAAVRFLKANAEMFCVDRNRICAAGESAGATLACLLGTTGCQKEYDQGQYLQYGSDVADVIDFYGLTDISLQLQQPANSAVPEWFLKAFLGDVSNAQRASAVLQVHEKTPPFLIFHGSDDPVIPIAHSDRLYQKLLEKQCPAEYFILEEAKHGDDAFYQAPIIDIIDQFLKNHQNM